MKTESFMKKIDSIENLPTLPAIAMEVNRISVIKEEVNKGVSLADRGAVGGWSGLGGELWSAWAAEQLHEGDRVKVIGVEGLRLRVRKVLSGTPDARGGCHG